MKKKIWALLLSMALIFCMFSSLAASCDYTKIEIIEPPGGYKVIPGGNVTIKYNAANTGVVTFAILEGAEYGDITNGGELTVKDGGKDYVGKIMKVAATHTNGDKVTTVQTTVTIVHIELAAIRNLSIPWINLYPGVTVDVSYTIVPANTTQDDIRLEVISGPGTIQDSKLAVSPSAGESEIKLKAVCGSVSSDVLTIPVKLPSNDPYYVSGPDTAKVESGALSQASFDVRVNHDDNGSFVDRVMVEFSVTKGAQLLNISYKGYTCYLNVLGHGAAEVTARLQNGRTFAVPITCIKTPSRLELPGYLAGKASIDYAVAKDQPFDFAAVVPSTGVDANSCRDVVYSFINDEIATYAGGKITFNETGRITVTARSNSGNSNGEISISRTFDVNDGINVSTWEQFKATLEDTANAGKNINIVATKSLTGYGYSLVPQLIIENNIYTPDEIISGVRVNCTFEVYLNGNGHAINISKLKYNEAWKDTKIGNFLLFRSGNDGADPGYAVKIRDLTLYGNVGIDGKNIDNGFEYPQPGTDGEINGIHECAIEIGNDWQESYYDISVENVKIYSFNVGMRISRALPGSICSSLEFDDNFKECMRIAASIIELRDIAFGNYGGFALEPAQSYSSNARDEGGNPTNQKITLAGDIKVPNKNAGNTKFLGGYKFLGNTMPQIIYGILASFNPALTDTQLNHIKNQNNEVSFFIFIFTDPADTANANVSQVIVGDIVNIFTIEGVRTAERFIEVPISIKEVGLDNLGKMIFFNMHYKA